MRKARWMRRILGIVLGAVAALGVLAVIDVLCNWLYPTPLTYDTLNSAELAVEMAKIPLPGQMITAFGWFAAAFAGAWLPQRVSNWMWAGLIVPLWVMGSTSATIDVLPYPMWMRIAVYALPALGFVLAERLHPKPYKGEPLLG